MTRHLPCELLQGAETDQLVNKFNNAVGTLDTSKLIQVLSNGPSVNVKFLLEKSKKFSWKLLKSPGTLFSRNGSNHVESKILL